MKKKIYEAIYRLFEEGDHGLTINVGGIELRFYDAEKADESPSVWNMGIVANDRVYKVGDLYCDGKGPGNYAELFSGDYDIIDGIADEIFNDNFKED